MTSDGLKAMQEFHYKISWRARGAHPGHHRGMQSGGASEFRGHAPLLAHPDPRRLDLLASLRDPFSEWRVRVYSQKSSIPVYLIADVSASMGFGGVKRKLDVLADFTAALGYSAYRTGDRFGFIGCDETVRQDFLLPPTFARGAGVEWAGRLRAFSAAGKNAAGLTQAHHFLGRTRALIFLSSDFHFPLDFLDSVLTSLARHDVVPLVLWDRAEYEQLPPSGLAWVQDSESGRRRLLWLRPWLQEKILDAFARRRRALDDM
ncbi:MAG: DUF58 domain-containing protein, partial [Burkholderiales bacterium]